MTTVELTRVSRWYRNVVAVNDITMTIGPGETQIGTGAGLLYLAVTLLLVAGSVGAMLLRYRKAAAA